ncbi:MAG: zinc ribbon domain-containing protein [Pseudomonadota bacterium]
MPIYEYQCTACGAELEALQKLSDEPLVECPSCHQPSLKKKISAAAFRLKGSGWYETDFKTGDKKNLAGGGESGKDGKDSKDAGGGDKGKSSGDKGGNGKKPASDAKASA